MHKEEAETIALQALAFMIHDPDLLNNLLESSGISFDDLRHSYQEREFLGGILDIILKDDEVLLSFCKEATCSPSTVTEARQMLPGGYLDQAV